MKLIRYLINLFLAIDQLTNTLLLGHPDETLSSRLGKSRGRERYFWVSGFRKLVDSLFFFDTKIEDGTGRVIHHCEKSVMPLEQTNFSDVVKYELWKWDKGFLDIAEKQ